MDIYISETVQSMLWLVTSLVTNLYLNYHQTSNISHTLVSNKIVNGAAPTARQDELYLSVGIFCVLY